ncbi:MAG: hypothetical protein IT395_04920 [Candidatus Omnitrophica bacterium]|nr:hypothetical protein [Candidatus Omnitrophota bacterium]
MVETLTIKDQIRKLIELQKLDGEIYTFKRDLREKPQNLAKLKEEFESKKVNLKAHEDQYKSLQLTHKALEGDMKSFDDNIAKANSQLSVLKTNKEYTAKLTEIENIKADKSLVEEKIINSYDAMDAAKAAIEKEKVVVAEEEKKYVAEKKVIEDSIKVLEDKARVLEVQRAAIAPLVPKISLGRYERVLQHTDGLAIVPVNNGVCAGCYMNVPAQVANQIKMNKELVFCETCARIIYLEEDL